MTRIVTEALPSALRDDLLAYVRAKLLLPKDMTWLRLDFARLDVAADQTLRISFEFNPHEGSEPL